MISAKEARQLSDRTEKGMEERTVIRFLALIDNTVSNAIGQGLHQATVDVPPVALRSLSKVVRGYKDLGFNVKVESIQGVIGDGVYVRPRDYLTLSW